MNGRMYDPLLGRFLNVDPVTSDPYFTQGYNKYSYVLNNPLKYTDPSGYYKRLDDQPLEPVRRTDEEGSGFGRLKSGVPNTGFGSYGGFGYGLPGQGGNGLGLNGVYFDWSTGTYRTTEEGNYAVSDDYSYQNASNYSEVSKEVWVGTKNNPLQQIKGFIFKDGSSYYFGDDMISFSSNGGGKNVPGGEWDFMGEGSVPFTGDAWFGTNFIGPGPDVNPYTLKLRPVDAVDKAAQRHDYYYWKEGASGIRGAVFDTKVAYADMILVGDAYNIMQSYRAGGMDGVTGLPISERTYNIAQGVYYSFLPLTINKIRP
jgi:hypothetical protein